MAISGDYVYLADEWVGLATLAIGDPSNYPQISFADVQDRTYNVAVQGDFLYVTTEKNLRIMDITDPLNPVEAGPPLLMGRPRGIVVRGDYAYVVDYYVGLRIVDVSDPSNPFEVGSYGTPSRPFDVALAGNYAYIVTGSDGYLVVVDIADPSNPWGLPDS